MTDLVVSERDMAELEKLLLPAGARFSQGAREVIGCWRSTEVNACPGSGKTTVLLAKLKVLSDAMPLEGEAGVCVLSHTNVAVDEVKMRLPSCAGKLLSHPNYIGTIQSFVDRFVTMPYLLERAGRSVQVVDDQTYALHMLARMQSCGDYSTLNSLMAQRFNMGGRFRNRVEQTKALHVRPDGALCLENHKRALAGKDSESARQYKALGQCLLADEGILRYEDAFSYAEEALQELPDTHADLFSARFRYVFIDEYQDSTEIQRRVLDALFDSSKCMVMKIGDADQAIYSSNEGEPVGWEPKSGCLSIESTSRFGQEIADAIKCLRRNGSLIMSSKGATGIRPVILQFDEASIDRVLGEFVTAMDRHGLFDTSGTYKAIGAIRSAETAGLSIGSYWPDFDGGPMTMGERNYWSLVGEIGAKLSEGRLYEAEPVVRRLICSVLHYLGKDISPTKLKKILDEEYATIYRRWVFDLAQCESYDARALDASVRQMVQDLIHVKSPQITDVFSRVPSHFVDSRGAVHRTGTGERNVYVDPAMGRRIQFDTIHGVKGETHDATLYLETETRGNSDMARILPCYGVGRPGTPELFDRSRKLAYVGFSRPRELLCVAMRATTYAKSRGVFERDWEIIDLRGD